MRNKFAGSCYRCTEWVEAGAGHFERHPDGRSWRVQHADCAIKHRGTPDQVRELHSVRKQISAAQGTGKRAQRARRALRDLGVIPRTTT